MRKDKLDFSGIKAEAVKIAEDEAAKNFVKGALRNNLASVLPTSDEKNTNENKERHKMLNEKNIIKKQPKKLVVDGLLKNRNEICQKPIQLYIKKELTEWIDTYTSSGRGGQQIMLNYLIKRGIEAVEEQYKTNGIVFADET